MKVLAKKSKPGEHYIKPGGEVVEICASVEILARTGKIAPMVSGTGEVYAYLLQKNGDNNYHRVAKDGKDLYIKIKPETEIEAARRPKSGIGMMRGPKLRTDRSLWRGWGLEHMDKMEGLRKLAEDEGCILLGKHHFFRICYKVGYDLRTICALFFNGAVGFTEKPQGLIYKYPKKELAPGEYLRYRILLPEIYVNDDWKEFCDLFLRYIRESKQSIEMKSRKVAA